MDRFRVGDRAALTVVYKHYVNDIELLLRKWGAAVPGGEFRGDFARQQDILQEIFVKAFSQTAREAYDGIRPYRPYLITIARRVMIDHLRKTSREILLSFDADDEERIFGKGEEREDSDYDQASNLHWQQCLAASKVYVEALDAVTRQFVELRFRQEMPQLMISETLGMTRWKVRALEKRIQRGLEKHLRRLKLLR